MPSTFFGLNIGTSGLSAYQAAINTTAHNISNADTKGYSRQVASQAASQALSVGNQYGMAGSGVTVTGIDQVRNQYYDMKYWTNNSLYGQYSAKEHYMLGIENYFSETNADGITAGLDKFYNALTSLSTDVANLTIRTEVTSFAESFTSYVNYLAQGLQRQQETANSEIKITVDQVNSIGKQISALNQQINTLEVNGGTANDLRDARALLVDELSQLANVSVTEKSVGEGKGVNQYVVRIDGKVLVDTYEYNQITYAPSETKNNQNDINGLYDLKWSNGQNFNSSSASLGGKLQALFEVRDGNNLEAFKGSATGVIGQKELTLTKVNIQDLNKLNIADSKGVILVGNQQLEYESFQATAQPDGTFTYTFALKEELKINVDETATIGKNVDYKGIPYYMSQLNEFIRTFSTSFNKIHNQAQDLDGEKGLDFFNGTNSVSGENLTLEEQYTPGATFTSLTSKATDGKTYGSYYHITASNFTVTKEVATNPRKVACSQSKINGVEDKFYLDKLIALKSDVTMFKQGTPDSFLQTLTAEVGIDTDKAGTFSKSQDNILKAIDNQRMSVSGVDTDEETMNLVKFQNAYSLSAKVISVMNQVFDKLINQMGV